LFEQLLLLRVLSLDEKRYMPSQTLFEQVFSLTALLLE